MLDELVGAHLLEQQPADRYCFHDLLRAYAIDQVRGEEEPDTRETVLRRISLWYLRQADAVVTVMVPGAPRLPLASAVEEVQKAAVPSYPDAQRWYEQERPNLVAVARSAMDAGFHDIAWQLPACLHRLYARLNHFDDWRITSMLALSAVREVGDRRGEAIVLESLAKLHTQSHELGQGIAFHQAALVLRRELGDRLGEASSLNGVGLAMSPAPGSVPGAGAPPARTGPLSGPSGPRMPPASGQGLRGDRRPPQDR